MPGYIKGILVALADTLLVALCIAVGIAGGDVVEAVFVISFMGFLPALVIGGLLGHYGETTQTRNRRVVLVGMAAIACTAVAFLGLVFEMTPLVWVSCVPTVACCSILERWTRAPKDDDLPLARVA